MAIAFCVTKDSSFSPFYQVVALATTSGQSTHGDSSVSGLDRGISRLSAHRGVLRAVSGCKGDQVPSMLR